jgi:hypothetical protein
VTGYTAFTIQKKNARLVVFSRAVGRAFYQYDFGDTWPISNLTWSAAGAVG